MPYGYGDTLLYILTRDKDRTRWETFIKVRWRQSCYLPPERHKCGISDLGGTTACQNPRRPQYACIIAKYAVLEGVTMSCNAPCNAASRSVVPNLFCLLYQQLNFALPRIPLKYPPPPMRILPVSLWSHKSSQLPLWIGRVLPRVLVPLVRNHWSRCKVTPFISRTGATQQS